MRKSLPPIPTLIELKRITPWMWVCCPKCMHQTPMAFVPLIIWWGPNTSSDKLRNCARCTECGSKGAHLQHPSAVDSQVGMQPFPAHRDRLTGVL
jgi:hypothetical protein